MTLPPPFSIILIVGAPIVVLYAVFRTTSLGGRLAERSVVAEAERVVGLRSRSRRWVKPTVLTVGTWFGVNLIAAASAPALGVWLGGLVVAVGAAAIMRAYPGRIDPEEFDRALQELLDQT